MCASDPVILPWVELYETTVDDLAADFGRWPSQRSSGVIWGHQQIFLLITTIKKKTRDMFMLSLCLSCRDASTDMQHNLLGSTSHLTWPYPRSNEYLTVKVIMYMLWRDLMRGTQCCLSYLPIFLSFKVMCKELFPPKRLLWHLLAFDA